LSGGGLTAALAACAAEPEKKPKPSGPTTVMIIRHAEKPAVNNTTPFGMDIDGNVDSDHSLSPTGWLRAGALTQLFGSSRNAPPAGLAKPTQLYASQGNTKSLRPVQTLNPLAAKLGTFVITKYSRDDVKALANELRAQGGPSLVAWESDALPTIPAALGKVTPTPPAVWPNDRFDMVWVLTTENGTDWKFSQVPQLLLAGDRTDPIA
jgi:hypothetical protein